MAASQGESKASLENARSILNSAQAEHEAAANGLQSAQESLEGAKKEADEALKKHGSADAIASLIEANGRRIKAESKRGLLGEELAGHAASQKSKLRDVATIGKQLDSAQTALARESEEYESLRTEHAAAELRLSVKVGGLCPVCLQTVSKLPEGEGHPSLEAAKLAVESRQVLIEGMRANKTRTETELGSLQQMMDAVEGQISDLAATIDEISSKVRARLAEDAGPDSGDRLLVLKKRVVELQSRCDESARLVELRGKEERMARDKTSKLDSDLAVRRATLEQLSLNLENLRGDGEQLRRELGKYADLATARTELEGQIKEKQKKDELEESLSREKKVL
ncbi:MAG: hypothetical protein ACREDR_47340, partial [Blastocatellia bacterium]